MKKKIFGALVVVAIAVGAMINVNLNKVSNNGDLALANVEALAQAENPPGTVLTCYDKTHDKVGSHIVPCSSCVETSDRTDDLTCLSSTCTTH